mmetsp:Transcript_10464/g.13262  ORF Transcript_10464/g.13262 Transcript_10464/m.13262 type:complete len:410 (+) Transcript_10464:185-1414(+)
MNVHAEIEESTSMNTIPVTNITDDFNDGANSSTEENLETPLLVHENGNNWNDQSGLGAESAREEDTTSCKVMKSFKQIIEIYTDQSGSCANLTKGLFFMSCIGTFLGIIMPKNSDLPHVAYQYLSSIIGYTYFVSWSVSFYPQIITNYQRKTIDGLSTDSTIIAVLNYTCYTIYNAFFFWDEGIRQEYKDKNGQDSEITVQSNDVAFAIHALFLTLVLLGQIVYYGGLVTQPISKLTICIISLTFIISGIYSACVILKLPGFLWINFLYIMATIKLILTIMTYIPQIVLNFHRKSTEGWNVWNPVFDFTGGLLSMAQLIFDSLDNDDFINGIIGNWAKFVLSIITLGFDGIFFTQHYYLYRDNNPEVTDSTNDINTSDYGEEEVEYQGCGYEHIEDRSNEDHEILTELV